MKKKTIARLLNMSVVEFQNEALTSIFDDYNASFSFDNLTQSIDIINAKPSIDKQIIKLLQEEVSLVWILFGTVGNMLSFLILCSKKMRIHSTFTYLTLLAVCDTLVLYFGLLRDYLVNRYQINVQGELFCKLHVFLFYFVLHMASWLLVAVNVDRLIAASFLSLSKRWCTPPTALKVSCWLAISLVLLNAHLLYFVGSTADNNNSNNPSYTLFNSNRNKTVQSDFLGFGFLSPYIPSRPNHSHHVVDILSHTSDDTLDDVSQTWVMSNRLIQILLIFKELCKIEKKPSL